MCLGCMRLPIQCLEPQKAKAKPTKQASKQMNKTKQARQTRRQGKQAVQVKIFGFFGDSVVSYDVFFFWKLSYERMFLLKQTPRGCFGENRLMVFFWKLPGKRACDVLLKHTIERTHSVWKGHKYNPTDSRRHSGIGSPCLLH